MPIILHNVLMYFRSNKHSLGGHFLNLTDLNLLKDSVSFLDKNLRQEIIPLLLHLGIEKMTSKPEEFGSPLDDLQPDGRHRALIKQSGFWESPKSVQRLLQ